jgi:hypothetical protein
MRGSRFLAGVGLLLAACGGGGGSHGGDSPPPPTPPFVPGPTTLMAPFGGVPDHVAWIDGDGVPDLLAFDPYDTTGPDLMSMLGRPDGTFEARAPFTGLYRAAIPPLDGRFNTDSHPDFVQVSSDACAVFFGDGDGGFAPATIEPTLLTYPPDRWAVGRGNEDNLDDLAFAHGSDVGWYVSDGKGGFALAKTTAVGEPCSVLLVSDVDHDGHDDIVALGKAGSVNVAFGDGAGGFQSVVKSSVGLVAQQAVIGEFDGDSGLDLVVTQLDDGNLYVVPGDGLGGFGPVLGIDTGANGGLSALAGGRHQAFVLAEDVNGAGGTSVLRLSISPPGPIPGLEPLDLALGVDPFDLAVTDMDLDGEEDLVVWGLALLPSFSIEYGVQTVFGTGASSPILVTDTAPPRAGRAP